MSFDSYWIDREDDSDVSHFGVKGMKWGVRRKEARAAATAVDKAIKKKYKDVKAKHQLGMASDAQLRAAKNAKAANRLSRYQMSKTDRGRYILARQAHDKATAQKVLRRAGAKRLATAAVGMAATVGMALLANRLNAPVTVMYRIQK